jgi:CBS-domain-containing membrane protein
VCIIWGGARDVAKNKREHGFRQMKRVVSSMNHTNLVIINVPHRHDLHESSCVNNTIKTKSESELYRPSNRHLLAKLVPAFVDKGCHEVSVTDPHGRILGFLDRTTEITHI